MGLVKHGKTYWIDYRIGKKRFRKSLHTGQYFEAIHRAQDVLSEARTPKPTGLPIEQFGLTYLEWARAKKPGSYRTEKYEWEFIWTWLANNHLVTLESIKPYDVERLRLAVLSRDRRTKDEHKCEASRATANRYLALLRLMFNRAREWGLTKAENPVSRVKFFPEREKVRPLSESEIEQALDIAKSMAQVKGGTAIQARLYDIMRFILNTGLRKSECLGLRWADVGDDSITIKGKGYKVRQVPLNSEARSIIESQAKVSQYVFDVPNRHSMSVLRRTTETISRHLGIRFHIHLLRHAFATRLLAKGVDVITLSDLLGHGKFMTTLLYSHSSPARLRQAVVTLDGQRHTDQKGPNQA